jgi:hypothetical protein
MGRLSQLLVCILLAGTFSACAEGATTVPLPAVLKGRWETDAPAYADRFFELTGTSLIIGTGGGNSERSTIVKVRRAVDKVGVVYSIEYLDPAGARNRMAFYFEGNAGGTIRLKNQQGIVWKQVRR